MGLRSGDERAGQRGTYTLVVDRWGRRQQDVVKVPFERIVLFRRVYAHPLYRFGQETHVVGRSNRPPKTPRYSSVLER